jgi:hypothetical protein
MSQPPLPDFIIVGPQKCATTWLYHALYEHPEVLMPETDSVHYFDMNYHQKEQWYRQFFSNHENEPVVGEETPTYIREQSAPKRIAETLPNVKLIFCLRNPIDRAFSHWWHAKSKDKHSFSFHEVLENYDLFQNWIIPGFYYRHITRYAEYFPKENMKLCFFDDLVEDDLTYVQDIYSFLDVDDNYVPSIINEKSNEGKYRAIRRKSPYLRAARTFSKIAPSSVVNSLRPVHKQGLKIHNIAAEQIVSKNEYEQGMNEAVRKDLEDVYEDEIRYLSDYTGRNLNDWFKYVTL